MSEKRELSPVHRLRSFSRPFSGSWEDAFATLLSGTNWAAPLVDASWRPSVDLVERERELLIRADLPGMSHDDVTISVESGRLTISGERETVSESDEDGVHRLERSYGRFSRSLQLPATADESEISAKFARGVLEITVPISEQSERERVIEITEENEE